jgi:hypothetical protein
MSQSRPQTIIAPLGTRSGVSASAHARQLVPTPPWQAVQTETGPGKHFRKSTALQVPLALMGVSVYIKSLGDSLNIVGHPHLTRTD